MSASSLFSLALPYKAKRNIKNCYFFEKSFWRTSARCPADAGPMAHGSLKSPISAIKTGRKKPFANRIRELRQLWRPLIGLLFTGRPAEPEPKRGRCSAGPAFLWCGFWRCGELGPILSQSRSTQASSGRKKPFASVSGN